MAEKMEILVEKRRRGARSNQKLKILYLAKILLDNTDANHDITLQEIIDRLQCGNGSCGCIRWNRVGYYQGRSQQYAHLD